MSPAPTLVENPTQPPGISGELLLGRYRVGQLLGRGGFGSVWEGFDTRLERPVAIKQLLLIDGNGDRIRQEARAAARLRHPAIVSLHEALQQGDSCYLITELVSGSTLDQLLQQQLLSDHDISKIGRAVGEGLLHAHSQGVVHRDVKPQNILVPQQQDQSAAKLADFGVAHISDGDTLTQAGDVIGTLAYMPPEQARGEAVTDLVDLYSLGLTLYECFSGSNPLRGENPAHTVTKITAGAEPLSQQRPDLPLELTAAIDQAIDPQAQQRGSLQQLLDALSACEGELSDTPHLFNDQSRSGLSNGQRRAVRLLLLPLLTGLAVGVVLSSASQPAVDPLVAAAVAAAATVVNLRLGWLAAVTGSVGVLLAGQSPQLGLAAVTLAALLPSTLLLWRNPQLLALTPGGALLGLVQGAAALPLIAALADNYRARVALAGCSTWLLLAADASGGRNLLIGLSPKQDPNRWQDSLSTAFSGVLLPIFSSGAVVLIPLFMLFAAVVPLLISRGPLAVKITLLAACCGALSSAINLVVELAATTNQAAIGNVIAVALGGLLLLAITQRRPASAGARVNMEVADEHLQTL